MMERQIVCHWCATVSVGAISQLPREGLWRAHWTQILQQSQPIAVSSIIMLQFMCWRFDGNIVIWHLHVTKELPEMKFAACFSTPMLGNMAIVFATLNLI